MEAMALTPEHTNTRDNTMRFTNCPTCGKPAAYTVDMMYAKASLSEPGDDGEQGYTGSSDVLWDTQKCVTFKGRVLLQCENYHEWFDGGTVKAEDEGSQLDPHECSAEAQAPAKPNADDVPDEPSGEVGS